MAVDYIDLYYNDDAKTWVFEKGNISLDGPIKIKNLGLDLFAAYKIILEYFDDEYAIDDFFITVEDNYDDFNEDVLVGFEKVEGNNFYYSFNLKEQIVKAIFKRSGKEQIFEKEFFELVKEDIGNSCIFNFLTEKEYEFCIRLIEIMESKGETFSSDEIGYRPPDEFNKEGYYYNKLTGKKIISN